MKKNLLKKFYAFIIPTISGAMLFSASSNAQFVYTDVIPDVAVTCSSTINSSCSAMDSIDINNDGVFDLQLSVGGSWTGFQSWTKTGFVKATPLNGSSIMSGISGYPLHLYRNDSIKSNSNWSSAANQILETVSRTYSFQNGTNETVLGNWTPPIDGFLGIKIVSGGQTYYGWIRLNVTINAPTASCTYKEFAYDSIPNQPILGGQISNPIIVGPIVYIPGPAFKSSLVNNAAINTDIDREIQVTEASAFTGNLHIYGSSISNLTGLEAFTAIDSLYCYNTSITNLDVTANIALVSLTCDNNNQLTNINIIGNTALTRIHCGYNNQLTSLDLSTNTALTLLNCANNQLTSLDVKNGNNVNFIGFSATGNPNLTCIQVDNVAYSNANWSAGKDATASFNTNCGVTAINDFDEFVIAKIFPNPANNHLTIALGSNNQKVEVTIADITGKVIYKTTATDVQKVEVNTQDFAAGIYVVRIQSSDFIATKKLVVER